MEWYSIEAQEQLYFTYYEKVTMKLSLYLNKNHAMKTHPVLN